MTPSVRTFRAMGCQVVVGGAGTAEMRAIRALFERREQAFSRFRPDSELTRVNRAPSPTLVVSELFAETMADALRAAAQTSGLVDPTLGLALEAAGYDRDFALMRSDDRPPGPGARGRVEEVQLRGRMLTRPLDLRLDLNGVVKGRAVDDALGLLSGSGFVAAGGDIAARTAGDDIAARGGVVVGLPDDGALNDGAPGHGAPTPTALTLHAGGLATSGTTRRRWRLGGLIQHHLIDPATGRPSDSIWTLVTVAAGTCRDADVAAKAAFLSGVDGPAWLDERDLPGRFLSPAGVVTNRTWQALLDAPEMRECEEALSR